MEAAAVVVSPPGARGSGAVGSGSSGGDGAGSRLRVSVRTRCCMCVGWSSMAGGRVCSRRCFGWRRRRRGTSRCSSFWPIRRGIRSCWCAAARSGSRRRSVWLPGLLMTPGSSKDGKHSPGVKRQYSGTLGKIGNCQITVSACTRSGSGGRCRLVGALYLPEEWCEDQRAAAEGEDPGRRSCFQTKPRARGGVVRAGGRLACPGRARVGRRGLRRRHRLPDRPARLRVRVRARGRAGDERVSGPRPSSPFPSGPARAAGRPQHVRSLTASPSRSARSPRVCPATRLARRSPCRDEPRPARRSRAGSRSSASLPPTRVRKRPPAAPGGVADHRMARRRGSADRLLALQPPRGPRATNGSPGSPGCAGRSSSTTASSKASSGSTTTKAEATHGFHHHTALVTCAHAFLTLERLDPKAPRPA